MPSLIYKIIQDFGIPDVFHTKNSIRVISGLVKHKLPEIVWFHLPVFLNAKHSLPKILFIILQLKRLSQTLSQPLYNLFL